ncbi:MAG: LysM peptidoglycan-binding domain-containing protein [Oceanipulchritudo sp.]
MDRRNFMLGMAGLVLPATLGSLWAAGGRVHLVRKGDTLSALAVRYGVTVSQIKRANSLKSDLIKVGQSLQIPDAVPAGQDISKLLSGIRVDRRRWTWIVGHHSATKYGNARIYDRNHRRRGMENGLAYHFVIGNGIDSGDGEIEIGPRWKKQLEGGHVRRREVNLHGIGICLVGNFEEIHPSRRQLAAFTALVDYLGGNVLKKKYTFAVHKEIDRNHTVCPGRNFPVKAMHARFG